MRGSFLTYLKQSLTFRHQIVLYSIAQFLKIILSATKKTLKNIVKIYVNIGVKTKKIMFDLYFLILTTATEGSMASIGIREAYLQ